MKNTVYHTVRHSIAKGGSSPSAPTITTQPASVTIVEGNTVTLSVVAKPPAGATLSYQWQRAAKGARDFMDVENATSDSYTTPVLAYADSGMQYRVIVIATHTGNAVSTARSSIATLSVLNSSNAIVWTHIDGTKRHTDAPSDGVLRSSTLTDTKTDIKSVDTIPSGVLTIGQAAFYDCSGLISITIPAHVTNIES